MKRILVVLSGGQDSTTCLFGAKHYFQTAEIHAITFDYGQRHVAELVAAKKVAKLAGVKSHEVIRLGANILKSTSPLVSNNDLEQYKDHNSLPGGLEKTFVPMRNQLFLTIAANRAYALGTNHIMTGVCEEDYGGYPDCRATFIKSFEDTSTKGTFTPETGFVEGLIVHTPLMHLTKADSVKLALKLPGCYAALAYSHTAYDGQYPPIGKDHATLLREKGFVEADVPDPLVLRAYKEERMSLPDLPNYRPDNLFKYATMLEL